MSKSFVQCLSRARNVGPGGGLGWTALGTKELVLLRFEARIRARGRPELRWDIRAHGCCRWEFWRDI